MNVVSQQLGHSSSMITMAVYAYVLPGNQREAANMFAACSGRRAGHYKCHGSAIGPDHD